MDELAVIKEILTNVNVPCKDNGKAFTILDRPNFIKYFLQNSNFILLKELNLSLIYQHKNCLKTDPFFLISCHIDSVYSNFFYKEYSDSELIGTFDNSICNAILLNIMERDLLPKNGIIAFTGDEENYGEGANQTAEFLKNNNYEVSIVIVLDITGEGYEKYSFTIENYYVSKNSKVKLPFNTREEMKDYLRNAFSNYKDVKFVANADPDETIEYLENDLCSLTFCLPSKPHPDNKNTDSSYWMHSDKGILIKKKSIILYKIALLKLLNEIIKIK